MRSASRCPGSTGRGRSTTAFRLACAHADGTLADGPSAVCEVQGYVCAAKRAAAELTVRRGDTARAGLLLQQAEQLRARIEEAFLV